jgi:aldehyde:ferredoxin oxidoreductase
MELYDKGIITEKEIGFPLEWGDSAAIVDLVKKTGTREGFGDELAEGSTRLAAKHGQEAIAFRGMEPPGYEPRAVQGQALSFATSPRGACHLRGAMYILEVFTGELDRLKVTGKEQILKDREDKFAVMDALLICKLGIRNAKIESWEDLAELLALTTGSSRTSADLMRMGERIWEAEMLFNEREGVGGPAKLPARFLEPQPSGPSKGAKIDKQEWEKALIDYYKLRGRRLEKEDIWT